MRDHFHLFVYGSLRAGGSANEMLKDCHCIGESEVGGILYDIDGEYRALVLYGSAPVAGEVWRCPNALLATLDEYEGVADGLFRRIGVSASLKDQPDVACWIYVAGPALAARLVPARKLLAP